MCEGKVAIYVSRDLYREIRNRVKESGGEFKSVEEYVEFVLAELLKEENVEEKKVFTPEEEEIIKKRLKNLGYL